MYILYMPWLLGVEVCQYHEWDQGLTLQTPCKIPCGSSFGGVRKSDRLLVVIVSSNDPPIWWK
jgi:hypothetical protein